MTEFATVFTKIYGEGQFHASREVTVPVLQKIAPTLFDGTGPSVF